MVYNLDCKTKQIKTKQQQQKCNNEWSKQSTNNSFYLPQHWYDNIQLNPGLIRLTLVQAMACGQKQQASAWTNDNQNLSSHKWQLEHTLFFQAQQDHQRCAKTQPYNSIYHKKII